MSECPICFESPNQLCKTDACNHYFCFKCLSKWAKENNYCPCDRIRFKKIILLEGKTCNVKQPKRKKHDRTTYDFTYYCEICSASDTATLILCDSCDLAYHTKCLNPPLANIPNGSWHCETCINVEKKLSHNPRKKRVICPTSNPQNPHFHPLKELKVVIERLEINDLHRFISKKEESLHQNSTQIPAKEEKSLHQNCTQIAAKEEESLFKSCTQTNAKEIHLESIERTKTLEELKFSLIENKNKSLFLSIKDLNKIQILGNGTLIEKKEETKFVSMKDLPKLKILENGTLVLENGTLIEKKEEPKFMSIKDPPKLKILENGTLYLDL